MFNLANIFTAGNLISGALSIILAFQGYIDFAAYAILLGALFDFLDGFAARMLKTSGELGKQLDSLADMVSFGLAPGIIMMVVLTAVLSNTQAEVDLPNHIRTSLDAWMSSILENNSFGTHSYDKLLPFTALIIPFFSLFRLAKFNLDKRQTESFIGLPTPANTFFFLSFPLILKSEYGEMSTFSEYIFHPLFMVILILIMSLLLISELPLFSLKFKSFGIRENVIRYTFLLISLILIIAVQVWAISLIVFLYLILSVVQNKTLGKTKD